MRRGKRNCSLRNTGTRDHVSYSKKAIRVKEVRWKSGVKQQGEQGGLASCNVPLILARMFCCGYNLFEPNFLTGWINRCTPARRPLTPTHSCGTRRALHRASGRKKRGLPLAWIDCAIRKRTSRRLGTKLNFRLKSSIFLQSSRG